MEPSLTDTLCTRCGLCCDGSLFADVELAGRAEATRLEILGLEIEEGDAGGDLLLQPCAALRGTRCSVYAHRPRCCRGFECRLLQEARRGLVTVDQAAERIAATRERIRHLEHLLAELGHRDAGLPLRERGAEALAADGHATPEVRRLRAELEAELPAIERLIRETFLGSGSKRGRS